MKKKVFRLSVVFLTGWLGGWAAQWISPIPQAAAESRILQADQLWIYAQDGR